MKKIMTSFGFVALTLIVSNCTNFQIPSFNYKQALFIDGVPRENGDGTGTIELRLNDAPFKKLASSADLPTIEYTTPPGPQQAFLDAANKFREQLLSGKVKSDPDVNTFRGPIIGSLYDKQGNSFKSQVVATRPNSPASTNPADEKQKDIIEGIIIDQIGNGVNPPGTQPFQDY